jgi:geranylgeranyl pyrophosphate synthase
MEELPTGPDPTAGGPSGPRQNAVPPTRQERDRLLGLIREYARNHPPVPPLSVSELTAAADAILARAEAGETYRKFVAVLFSNEAWRDAVAAVPCSRRLLLLPKCLRAEGRCEGTFDEIGLVCEDCGQCPISGLKKEAERLGYAVLVAEGAPVVLSVVQSRKIEAVVGVSCLTALELIYPLMQSAAIPGIAIPLLYDGCVSTAVDLDWVRDAIRLVGGASATRMNLDALRDEVEGWFSNAALQETLGPATTETERIARAWLAKSGKRWRPLLAAGAYEALGGRSTQRLSTGGRVSASDSIRKVALAIECFHKASLVHDDIEDEDALRYGERTLHEEYGIPVALNVGDFLLGEGYRMIAESGLAPERVAEMLRVAAGGHRDLAIGQGLELCWTRHPGPLRSADVLDIFRRKTAPAFEVALRLGAVAAGAGDGVWDILGRYSTALGVAYQIRDDLKDWDGKAEPDDAGAMRPSILLAIAHERAEGDDRRFLEEAWRRSLRPAATAERVRAILVRLNAQPEARRLLSLYMDEAIRSLEAISSHDLKALLRRVLFKIFSDVTPGSLPGESEVGTAPSRAAGAGPAA